MNHEGYWWGLAVKVMEDAIEGKPPEDWEKAIDQAYAPVFGPRKHWPYRVWLKAKKEFLRERRLSIKQGKLV